MSSKIFMPDSWRKAGGAVEDAGGDVASRIRSRLGSVQLTGEGGLTLLDEHLRQPDLILCDYRLRQHQDGLDAIRRIRRRVGQAVPAIIITGDTGAADLRRVTDAGLPLLHKPVGADRLLAAVEAALDAHPTGGCETMAMDSDSDHEDSAGR